MTVSKTPDGRWYVQFQVNKVRKKEYFGHGDLSEARAIKFQEELDIRKGRSKLEPESILTAKLCERYQAEHLVEKSTAKMDVYKFLLLSAKLGEIPAESLTTKHLNDYVTARIKQGIKRATIKNEIARLKAAFSWAEDQDPPLILRNRIHKFKMGRVGERDIPLPPNTMELEAILKSSRPQVFRALMLARYCGMRPGPRELFRVRWYDVDWQGSTLRVPCAHKGGPVTRMVPIPGPLLTQMREWHKADSALSPIKRLTGTSYLKENPNLTIVHYYGKPVKSIKKSWTASKSDAEITRRIRPYDLRHAFVTEALRSGSDLKATSEVIGHSRPDTTLKEYQHVTKEDHRKVVDLTPDICGGFIGGISTPKSKGQVIEKTKFKKSVKTSQV
ncbi:MAG: tyrosine-type recombinase/integrase [Syntrophobacteraceae bacterium]